MSAEPPATYGPQPHFTGIVAAEEPDQLGEARTLFAIELHRVCDPGLHERPRHGESPTAWAAVTPAA